MDIAHWGVFGKALHNKDLFEIFLLNPEDEGPPSGAGQEATRSLKEPQVGKVERGSGRQAVPPRVRIPLLSIFSSQN